MTASHSGGNGLADHRTGTRPYPTANACASDSSVSVSRV